MEKTLTLMVALNYIQNMKINTRIDTGGRQAALKLARRLNDAGVAAWAIGHIVTIHAGWGAA